MAKCRIGTAKFFTLLLLLYRTSAKMQSFSAYPDQMLDPVFEAVSEMCEEAVLSALLHAEPCTGLNGKVYHSLREFEDLL
jgi:L-aminopeptidase/D-esterase-like protein